MDHKTALRTTTGNSEITLSRIDTVTRGTLLGLADNTVGTIVSFTPTVNHNIIRLGAGGQDYGKFEFFINSVRIETRRSAPQRFVDWIWPMPLGVDAFDVLEIKVEHFFVGQSLDFEAVIYSFVQP